MTVFTFADNSFAANCQAKCPPANSTHTACLASGWPFRPQPPPPPPTIFLSISQYCLTSLFLLLCVFNDTGRHPHPENRGSRLVQSSSVSQATNHPKQQQQHGFVDFHLPAGAASAFVDLYVVEPGSLETALPISNRRRVMESFSVASWSTNRRLLVGATHGSISINPKWIRDHDRKFAYVQLQSARLLVAIMVSCVYD